MATVNTWAGATTNYDTGTNWSGGSKPALNEKVQYNGDVSNVSVVTGQDNEGGVNLAGVYIGPTYSGDIGTSGAPWVIGMASGATIWHCGSGKLYLKAGTTFSAVSVVIDCVNASTIVELDCTTANFADVLVMRGTVNFIGGSGATKFNRIAVGYRDDPINDANVTIQTTVTSGSIDCLDVWGGKIVNDEPLTLCTVSGGVLTHRAGLMTELKMHGGRVNFNYSNGASDAATRVQGIGGVFDMTQSGGQKVVGTMFENPGFEIVRVDDDDIHKLTTWISTKRMP